MQVLVLKPSDPPPGTERLLTVLQKSLVSGQYSTFRFMVAFARLSGLARLLTEIRQFRATGKAAEGIVGVDHFGTSKEALDVLLDEFDAAYVTGTIDRTSTFHPKMYLFHGSRAARAIVGSHNLTSGGLETNFEGGVVLDFDLPSEATLWQAFHDAWDQLLPGNNACTSPLTASLISDLVASLQVRTEAEMRRVVGPPTRGLPGVVSPPLSRMRPAPPSALPRRFLPRVWVAAAPTAPASGRVIELRRTVDELSKALVIEILPHPNGEVFLSKTAADAFPSFFGMPFTGRTVPKYTRNPSYPMREPDPLVELRLHDSAGKRYVNETFRMNTVLYEAKSEVRVTIHPSYARSIPDYSILVMWRPPLPDADGLDYLMDVFAAGSAEHIRWERVLNLTLPSGGKPRARRMGWV